VNITELVRNPFYFAQRVVQFAIQLMADEHSITKRHASYVCVCVKERARRKGGRPGGHAAGLSHLRRTSGWAFRVAGQKARDKKGKKGKKKKGACLSSHPDCLMD